MATPRNGFAREAMENERRARESKNPFKDDRPAVSRAEVRRRNYLAVQSRIREFERLQPGDGLGPFGIDNVVVAKKNPKSVISTMGNKYTRQELTGENSEVSP